LIGDGERNPGNYSQVHAVAQARAEVGGVLARAVEDLLSRAVRVERLGGEDEREQRGLLGREQIQVQLEVRLGLAALADTYTVASGIETQGGLAQRNHPWHILAASDFERLGHGRELVRR